MIESRLFTKTDPGQVIMYLYRNEPSVIIGRNQVRPRLRTVELEHG